MTQGLFLPGAVSFTMCGSFRRDDCIVDGDTFHFGGETIRVADIDAPRPTQRAATTRPGCPPDAPAST